MNLGIHAWGEWKCTGLSRNFTFPHFYLQLEHRQKMNLRWLEVSADPVKSQHRWLNMQPFSPTRLVAVECRSLIHDLDRRGYDRVHVCVCVYVEGGCSGMLVWILSSSWLCHNFWKALLLKHFFSLWPEILMAEQRQGVGERVESAVTVSVDGWLNYNLRFISYSWHCQRREGKEVSLWQRGILEDGFVPTNVRFPSTQLH